MSEFLFQLIGLMATAGAVYAAIRADLAEIRTIATNAGHEAAQAHKRIDDIMLRRISNHGNNG